MGKFLLTQRALGGHGHGHKRLSTSEDLLTVMVTPTKSKLSQSEINHLLAKPQNNSESIISPYLQLQGTSLLSNSKKEIIVLMDAAKDQPLKFSK